MLAEILHRVVANPVVYDAVQSIAGTAHLDRRASSIIGQLPERPVILDVGGGTGLSTSMWPAGALYVCLDIDPVKLAGFRRNNRPGEPVCGDATHLPVRSASVELLVCKLVSHHLGDDQLVKLFEEGRRALKPGGRMLFVDAVAAPDRWRSRALWRYDRGSHPRSSTALRQAMAEQFQVTDWEELTMQHRYVLGAGTPRDSGG